MSFSSVEDLSEAGRSAHRGHDQLATKIDLASLTPGRRFLRRCLGRSFRVVITDGRILIGIFNCTDKDANIVLTMCAEYLTEDGEPRILGNVMIPGKHIVKLEVERHSSDDEDFSDDEDKAEEVKRNETAAVEECDGKTEKLQEESPTQKLQDEPSIEKQQDEPSTEKQQDEPPTEQLREEPPTEKQQEKPPAEAAVNSDDQQEK